MNGKQYVLTDGVKYIKINPQGDPVKTGSIAFAHVFKDILEANDFLKSQQMVKINRDNGKSRYIPEEYEGFSTPTKAEDNKLFEDISKEISELDGAFKDFDDIKLPDKENNHVYSGKTYMEYEDFDIYEFMKQAVNVFSSISKYTENMAYLEREMDLKILDIRHYKRNKNTKLNAIEAQQLEYLEQDLERERISYKTNRIIAELFVKDISRIKNKAFLSILDDIHTKEYRYRRLNKDDIEQIIKSRRSKFKVV